VDIKNITLINRYAILLVLHPHTIGQALDQPPKEKGSHTQPLAESTYLIGQFLDLSFGSLVALGLVLGGSSLGSVELLNGLDETLVLHIYFLVTSVHPGYSSSFSK
jgi:hypothetical protein